MMGSVALAVLLSLGHVPLAAALGDTVRTSVSSSGEQGSDKSWLYQTISADGRFTAFWSQATNLVPGDTNGKADLFVHDRQFGRTKRISVSSTGEQANDASYHPLISGTGVLVAFSSPATNLVAGDTNNWWDAFVYNRITGSVQRIKAAGGLQVNGNTYASAISRNGRYLVLASEADNLVPGDTNGATDIFVRDRLTGKTERVDVASDGTEASTGAYYYTAISDDGRHVAFYSDAANLVADDTNGQMDVFVRDRFKNTTTRLNVDSNGQQGDGPSYFAALSASGRYVAFASGSTNLVAGDTNGRTDIFLHDQLTRKVSRINLAPAGEQADQDSTYPRISADGRYIGYSSDATNLVAGDGNGKGDAFVYDRLGGKTARVSVNTQGKGSDGSSSLKDLSGDGRYVSFSSDATNLVAGDTNGVHDTFVRDRFSVPKKSADLSVTQTDAPDPVTVGGSVTYTVTVQNDGPDAATYAALTDILQGKAGVISAAASQGTCRVGQTVVCRLGQIDAGSQATVTVTVRAGGAGVLANQVHINAGPNDPNPNNNHSTVTTTVSP